MSRSDAPLLAAERHERILADLRARGTLRVRDIAQALGVAAVTVRRDVAQLADEGVIERVHGGIRLPRAGDMPHTRPAEEDQTAVADDRPAVGMVVPSLDYYWPEIIRGARETADGAGVRVVLRGSSYDDVADIRRQVTWLLETAGVQGLLVAPPTTGLEAEQLITWLTGLPIPVTFVERNATVGPYHDHVESVTTDHAFGASLAVRHLAAAGHHTVGFLATAISPTTAKIRAGWRQTVDELGLSGAADMTCPDYRSAEWHTEVSQALDACTAAGVTALLVHPDREAISLLAACDERGIRVPGDLAVIAYDDEVAGLANPALSAVRPAKHAIGEAAVQLMARRMLAPDDWPVHRVQVSPRLVIRDSA